MNMAVGIIWDLECQRTDTGFGSGSGPCIGSPC